MKAQIALRPALQLLRIRYPLIDPEDAWQALVERTVQKVKGRKARTAERIEKAGDDVFFALLAAVPSQQWPDSVWHEIGARTRETGGKFWKRLVARRDRESLFKPEELFLLENWRTLRFPDHPKNKPGLQAWHPEAVMYLLRVKGVYSTVACDADVKWYYKRRKSLGLSPSPYTVPKSYRV